MRIQFTLLSFLALSAMIVSTAPVLAQDAQPVPGAKHHHHGGFAGHKLQAIKSLSSLTPDQSQQIDRIMADLKSQSAPLRGQLKSLRTASTGTADGTAASADAATTDATKAKFEEIRSQLHAQARTAMEKVFAVLTPDQKKELAAKRAARRGGTGGTMDGATASPDAKS